MIIVVLAGLAAALHVYIFWMESLAWEGPRARKVFGPATPEEVAATRQLAFNQGFYNLFLALIAVVGIVFVLVGDRTVGIPLILAGTGAMLAAALVLLLSAPGKRTAAITQGALPLLTVLAVVVGL